MGTPHSTNISVEDQYFENLLLSAYTFFESKSAIHSATADRKATTADGGQSRTPGKPSLAESCIS